MGTTTIKLTEAQLAALATLARGPRSPWDFGSTTVNRLRAYGYAVRTRDEQSGNVLAITDAGRAALATAEGKG